MNAELASYLVLLAAGFLPNEVWRMLGVVVAHGLDERSELVLWVRSVATALLAGVVAKLVFFPPAGLAEVHLAVRLIAIAVGFATFLTLRRSVFAAVLAAEATLMLGALWLAG